MKTKSEKIVALLNKYYSAKKIAKKLHCSIQYVYNIKYKFEKELLKTAHSEEKPVKRIYEKTMKKIRPLLKTENNRCMPIENYLNFALEIVKNKNMTLAQGVKQVKEAVNEILK